VDLKIDPNEVITSIAKPKKRSLRPAAIDMSAIEVEAKGKEVKEGETPAPELPEAPPVQPRCCWCGQIYRCETCGRCEEASIEITDAVGM